MYIFPDRVYNVRVDFKVGDSLVSPTSASYEVVDSTSTIVPSTPLAITPGETGAWVTVSGADNQLGFNQPFSQRRIEVTFIFGGMEFVAYTTYYVVPDLFIDFTPASVKSMFGLSDVEISDSEIDFYSSYVDLARGPNSEALLEAIANNDPNVNQLILYTTMFNLLPSIRFRAVTSIQSDTSKMSRALDKNSFAPIQDFITTRYNYYVGLVLMPTTTYSPALLVTDTPTDPITGS